MEELHHGVSSLPHTLCSAHLISEGVFLTSHLLINDPLEQIETEASEVLELALLLECGSLIGIHQRLTAPPTLGCGFLIR